MMHVAKATKFSSDRMAWSGGVFGEAKTYGKQKAFGSGGIARAMKQTLSGGTHMAQQPRTVYVFGYKKQLLRTEKSTAGPSIEGMECTLCASIHHTSK